LSILADTCLLPPQITGDRVEDNILDGLRRILGQHWPNSERCAFELPADVCGPRPRTDVEAQTILVTGDPDQGTFSNFSRSRLTGCLQVDADDNLIEVADKLTGLVRNDLLFVSLKSRSAYDNRLAVHLCDKLNMLFNTGVITGSAIRSALVEALQNAIVHGNLELPTPEIQDASGFEKFASRINERLQDKTLGGRAVDVEMWKMENSLYISVTDQGRGFDLDAKDRMDDPDDVSGTPYTGRGHLIIEKMADRMWVDQGGRRTIMRFD